MAKPARDRFNRFGTVGYNRLSNTVTETTLPATGPQCCDAANNSSVYRNEQLNDFRTGRLALTTTA